MLIRLIYLSTATEPQTQVSASAILKTARAWNQANEVTGMLCQGQGFFLQAIEGERRTVTRLYARIYEDRRHTHIELISCETIAKRRYSQWAMAHVDLHDADPVNQVVWAEFDPYSNEGRHLLQHIDALLISGTAVAD